MSDIDKIHLGDSLLNIIIDNSKIFKVNVVTFNKNTEISISLIPSYVNKLALSTITVSHIPMLVIPNPPSFDGKYSPYLNPFISHIFTNFNTVVKNNHNILFKTEHQSSLINSISYLNSIPFIINLSILNYLNIE